MPVDLRKLAQDGVYVAVGLGVLTFQRAQVARRDIRSRLESEVRSVTERTSGVARGARSAVDTLRAQARDRLEAQVRDARRWVEPVAAQVQQRLPDPLARLVSAGRSRLQPAPPGV